MDAGGLVARCGCGARYAHEQWCALPRRDLQLTVAGRLDVRSCACGAATARALDDAASVCVECGAWITGSKSVMPDGVRCASCAMWRNEPSRYHHLA